MIYQHPLAFLLGIEGQALLRGFNGEYDREFTLAGRGRSGRCSTLPTSLATSARWR